MANPLTATLRIEISIHHTGTRAPYQIIVREVADGVFGKLIGGDNVGSFITLEAAKEATVALARLTELSHGFYQVFYNLTPIEEDAEGNNEEE